MARTNLERNVRPKVITNLNGTVQDVTTAPGYLIKVIAYNADHPSVRFIQVFDALAANVLLGVTAPKYIIPVPTAVIDDNDFGIEFNTAISMACTTTPNGSVSSTGNAAVTVVYKEL